MKSPVEVAAWLAQRLDEDGLPYGLGGALALAVWGAPRQTIDVDLMVFVDDRSLDRVIDAMERAGMMIDRAEVTRSVAATGMFIAQLGGFRVDLFLATHPVHEAMLARRRELVLDGHSLWFLSAEDLALLKLFYGRPKDVIDLERLFAAQPALDVGYLGAWLRRMVPDGDRRLGLLDDLASRFGGGG